MAAAGGERARGELGFGVRGQAKALGLETLPENMEAKERGRAVAMAASVGDSKLPPRRVLGSAGETEKRSGKE